MARTPSEQQSAITVAVAGFLDTCRSANTAAAYGSDLRHVAAWCRDQAPLNLLSIDAEDVARYRTACELAGASPATIARRLSTIASFESFATASGAEPVLGATAEIARPALRAKSSADVLTDVEATAMLGAADMMNARAAVLIRLLMLDGLKVGEVIRADASDATRHHDQTTLLVRDRRPRTIVLHDRTGRALRRYLGRRRDGPLLLSERPGRAPERLTRFGVDYIVKKVALAARLQSPVSANTLRRRYVVAAHADGADIDTIRQHTGHADRRTTIRYLAPDPA